MAKVKPSLSKTARKREYPKEAPGFGGGSQAPECRAAAESRHRSYDYDRGR
ncbi:hypothetical protein [Petralouisia muris]|uniref:hypothetical protein n=1 Tax=Petralouisia muris TaxID=3032872 RepID=UPI001441E339|nr:hypothetical protein [Petralouisia muris]